MSRSQCRMRSNWCRSCVAAAIERLEGRVLLSTYTVSNLNDSGPGSLRDAIQQANAHAGADDIDFPMGLKGTITLTSGPLTITGDLSVNGLSAFALTVSGNGSGTVFNIVSQADPQPMVHIKGLTISDSGGDEFDALVSAGIYGNYPGSTRPSVTLDDCTLTNSGAGGISNFFGVPMTLNHCTITHAGIDNFGAMTLNHCTIHKYVAIANEEGGGSMTLTGCEIVDGGGINDLSGGPLAISDTVITGSGGGNGAAVTVNPASGGTLAVTNSRIGGNPGSGIYSLSGTITDSTVYDNGGYGIFDDGELLTISDSTISGNAKAGILGDQAHLVVTGSTIAANKGDGIEGVDFSSLILINSTVANNTNPAVANNVGGGINVDNQFTITNSTIVGNVGPLAAGVTPGTTGPNHHATINNSIIAGNHDANGGASDLGSQPQSALTGSNNLIGTGGSGGLVNGKNGNVVGVADPKLAPLGDYGGPTQTMRPLPGSPVIDAGSNALAVGSTDQRGYDRIVNGTVDIGAVEAPPSPAVVTNLNDSGLGSLRQAIKEANINLGPDTITFAPGLSGTITLTSGDLDISDVVTITGPGRSVLTISGGGFMGDPYASSGQHPAINVSGLTLKDTTLSGDFTPFTLVDCAFTHSSVTTIQSVLVIRGCTISDSSAIMPYVLDASGSTFLNSAIFSPSLVAGAYSFTDCTITGSQGDGIAISGEGVTLTRCTVSNNAGYGISDYEETVQLIDSTVSGNGRGGIAGGDTGPGGEAGFLISGSTIANNKGPGISYVGAATIVNSTFANNMGGGIDANGRLVVTNSTIVGNVGKTFGGISAVHGTTSSGWVINNSIVAGNRDGKGNASDLLFGPAFPADHFTGSNNLIGTDRSGAFVNGQNGNIVGVADPMLAPLGDYGGPTQTMPPLPGSPAIDAGSNAAAVGPDLMGPNSKPLVSDQRGYYRIVNGKVDIGAVELNATPLVPGDANGDGKVDFSDLLIIARTYGTKSGATWSSGDFTGDGAVGFDDLLILARNYGKTRMRHLGR